MDKIKKMIFIAIVDAIATQIFISIFPGSFRISLSVAILPVFYYWDNNLNPLKTAVFISCIGLLFRGLVNVKFVLGDYTLFIKDINIILFDLVYGLIFYYFYYKKAEKPIFSWLMVVFFADLVANVVELISRKVSIMFYLNELIVVAFIRTIIAFIIVLLFYYFINVFKKEIDRKKYYDLLGMFSDIKSEVYLMNNNIRYIEDVMTDAYMLYDNIENENLSHNKKQALKIAQNVHEIKKNYLGILSGLGSVEFKNGLYDNMRFYKILDVLEKYTTNFVKDRNENINVIITRGEDFYVMKHYYIMSILRNLINNSVESLIDCDKINRKVTLKYLIDEEYLHVSIYDNGKGIQKKNINYIFNSGFSTKFINDGKIHRGLGLTLIRDIIKNEFNGEIRVLSNYDRFTQINIKLKLKDVKGESNEYLHY